MKRFSLTLAAFCLGGAALAQQPPATTTLRIEAGLVYKVGGVQPVARVQFLLLDNDPWPDIEKLPASQRWGDLFPNAAKEFEYRCGKDRPDVLAVFVERAKYKVDTDFSGKAELGGVKPGKYWLFGVTETRSRYGCAYWWMPVDLNTDQRVILDQNNAAAAR